MRILLVQETDWFEKGPLQQNHLMEKLSSRGHEVRVIDHEILWRTHRGNGLWSKRKTFDKVSKLYPGSCVSVIRPGIIRIPTLDYLSILFSRRKEITRQIKEYKPDVIIGFQILTPYLASSLAKKHRIPFVYYWTDVYHSQIPFKPYRLLGRFIENLIIRNTDVTLAINEKLKDYTIRLGASPEKCLVLKGTVDVSRFNQDIVSTKIREKLNIGKNDFVICFVGLFHKLLALNEVLISIAGCSDQTVKLLLVGEGDQHAPNKVEELKRLAADFNVQNRVIITGRRPYNEIPDLIGVSNVCIFPSHRAEMMNHIVPIKMYEYMAMQKPVIATDLIGIKTEFGFDNGVIFVDSPEQIVPKALEIRSLALTSSMGIKARNFVEQNSWEKVTSDFEKILSNLIQSDSNNIVDGHNK